MKQLLARTGNADSTITSEAVMAMAEKFNTGQETADFSVRGGTQPRRATVLRVILTPHRIGRSALARDI